MGGLQNTPVLKSGFSGIFTGQLSTGKSLSYASVAAPCKTVGWVGIRRVARDGVQLVERLPSMHAALGSILSTT